MQSWMSVVFMEPLVACVDKRFLPFFSCMALEDMEIGFLLTAASAMREDCGGMLIKTGAGGQDTGSKFDKKPLDVHWKVSNSRAASGPIDGFGCCFGPLEVSFAA